MTIDKPTVRLEHQYITYLVSASTGISQLPPWWPVALATSFVAVPMSPVAFASTPGTVTATPVKLARTLVAVPINPETFARTFESVPVTLVANVSVAVAMASVAFTAGMMLVGSHLMKKRFKFHNIKEY